MSDLENTGHHLSKVFEKICEEYLLFLQQQKNYSSLTIKNYRHQLSLLLKHISSLNINHWHDLKTIHIRQLSAQQHRLGKSSKSIALLLSSSRSFFQFLINKNIMQSNPAKNVRAPKGEKKLPKTIDIDQVFLLLNSIDKKSEIGIRDKAIAELFYSSGLRLAELAFCNMSDVDLDSGLIRVTGKGNKQRILPIGKHAKLAMSHWLKVRLSWLPHTEEQALFISQRKSRISHRSIQKRLEYWGKKIGLNASLHPHKFRHSCATHVLESSGDIRAVQELLGHQNISTTQIYTHLDFQKLAEVYDKSHPRAKK